MATSTLKFYKVAFDRDLNAYIDDIDNYLNSIMVTTTIENFQYIRHDLNIEIKINWSQADVDDFLYNYCSIQNGRTLEEEDETFYYYVDKVTQVAQNTLLINLSMDTINSLGNDASSYCNPRKFTNETEIMREHEDRFIQPAEWDYTTGGKMARKIDVTVEDIMPASWIKTKDNLLENDLDDDTWYLIYSGIPAQSGGTYDPDANNPIVVSLCAESGKTIKTQSSTEVLIADEDKYYIGSTVSQSWTNDEKVLYITDPNVTIKFQNLTIKPGMQVAMDDSIRDIKAVMLVGKGASPYLIPGSRRRVFLILDPDSTFTDHFYAIQNTYKNVIDSNGNMYLSRSKFGNDLKFDKTNPVKISSEESAYVYHGNTITYNIGTIEGMSSYTITTSLSEHSIATISDIDKTHAQLLKIISLPYCPIDFTIDNDVYVFNDPDWQYHEELAAPDNKCIRYIQDKLPKLLKQSILNLNIADQLIYNLESPAHITDLERTKIELESKLYNSQYKIVKLGFDTFSKELKLERFNNIDVENDPTISIDYKVSNGLSSEFGFNLNRLNAEYKDEEDFDNVFIISRNNELPLYSSNYLNYVRNGYNYDIKEKALNTQQRAVTSAVEITSTAAAGAMMGSYGGAVGTAIGVGIGVTVGVTKAIISGTQNAKREQEAINNKLAELSKQGLSISSSSDLDMLTWYSSNRLHFIEYIPNDMTVKKVYNLFRYYGYAHSEYRKPEVDTRCWYNFIQCDPHIDYEGTKNLKKSWVDDLKSKYQNGVTVFHHHNIGGQYDNYDFDRHYENWENWIVGIGD